MSDPAKVLKSLYGSYVGELLIFLDLGTLAIKHGESASSVMDRLVQLSGFLVNSLRYKAKGDTRVLVLPPHSGSILEVLKCARMRPLWFYILYLLDICLVKIIKFLYYRCPYSF